MVDQESERLKELLFTAAQRATLSDDFLSAVVGKLRLERCDRAEAQLAKAISDKDPNAIVEQRKEAAALLGKDAPLVQEAQAMVWEGLYRGQWYRGIYRGTVTWSGEQYFKLYTRGFLDRAADNPGEWYCRDARVVPLDLDEYWMDRERDAELVLALHVPLGLIDECVRVVALLSCNPDHARLQRLKDILVGKVATKQASIKRHLEALMRKKDVRGLAIMCAQQGPANGLLLDAGVISAARRVAREEAVQRLHAACGAEVTDAEFEAARVLAAQAGADNGEIDAAAVRRAEFQLKHAADSQDYARIEELCNSPASAVMSQNVVYKAKQKAKHLRCRHAESMVTEAATSVTAWMASTESNPKDLLARMQVFEKTCDDARILSAADPASVVMARDRFWKVHAIPLCRIAAASETASIVEYVYHRALQVGVVGPEILEAVRAAVKLKAATALATAHEHENAHELVVAAARAESAGLDAEAVAGAYRKAERMNAERCMVDSLESGDPEEVGRACREAQRCGVSEEILEAVMAKCDLMTKVACQTSETSVRESLKVSLQMGLPVSTSRLAELLAGALVHKTNEGETLQLFADAEKSLVFEPGYSRIYSSTPAKYGFRGGHPYFKPSGWARYSVRQDQFDEKCRDWCVGYHGTMSQSIISILCRGLRRPGDAGVIVAHGQAHSKTRRSIYLSPSVEYAAFPCYAQFFKVAEDHWVQVVLQCRVRPGAFQKCPGTLGGKHWPEDVPIDPNFESMANLEWLLEDANDVVVYGVMVREFGAAADVSLYGDLVRQVTVGERGPEYEWTRLRADDLRNRGLRMQT